MASVTTVKVSSRNQIALPRAARQMLHIRPGDRLLVDIQDGMLVLMPQPESYTEQLASLHPEVWTEIDGQAYLDGERDAWLDKTTK